MSSLRPFQRLHMVVDECELLRVSRCFNCIAPHIVCLMLATSVVPVFTGTNLFAEDRHAFLVGVQQYDPAELTSLRYTEKDVTDLAETLGANGYEEANIVLMTQAEGEKEQRFEPSAAKIENELQLMLARVAEDDSVLVAFSGHGVQFDGEEDAYFCSANAKLDDRSTLISLASVYQLLQRCSARTRLLLVDACRNDPRSNVSKSVGTVELESAGLVERQLPPGGIVAFYSCSPGEESYEHPDLEHGVFLNFVIEALSGQGDLDDDNEISLSELEQYVVKNTEQFVRVVLGRAQTPERRGEARGLLTLARIVDSRMTGLEGRLLTNSIGMELVLIPSGKFLMGDPEPETSIAYQTLGTVPQHEVMITQPFFMGKYEVTQSEWEAVMMSNPSFFPASRIDASRFPVDSVGWYDAIDFCNNLSVREGLPVYYRMDGIERENGRIERADLEIVGGNGYRLPTEAEWEYSCRAGTTTMLHFGSSATDKELNATGPKVGPSWANPLGTMQVGSFPSNDFGLFDMHGNIAEWCFDWYDSNTYKQRRTITENPVVTCPIEFSHLYDRRVLRGGSWSSQVFSTRSAHRGQPPFESGPNITMGFRIARSR